MVAIGTTVDRLARLYRYVGPWIEGDMVAMGAVRGRSMSADQSIGN